MNEMLNAVIEQSGVQAVDLGVEVVATENDVAETTAYPTLDGIAVVMRNPKELSPHPLNETIYGDLKVEDLMIDIAAHGVQTPLHITAENIIISGHRRHRAAVALQLPQVPVLVIPVTDDVDVKDAIVRANVHRTKTDEQRAREYRILKEVETERAKGRQQLAAGETNLKQGRKTLGENFPEACGRQGRARDLAAEVLGWSGKTAERADELLHLVDSYAGAGDADVAAQVRSDMQKSIHHAYSRAKKKGMIPSTAKAESDQHFNKTNDSIDWAGWSWNPVTGCKHDCEYCYARTQANLHRQIFPKGFEPDFREERLTAPRTMKVPKNATQRQRTVFVCSMADLFGDWVPQAWIDAVLTAVREAPQWTFIFLTKNPARLVDIEWPANAWVGTTVDTQARVVPAEEAFSKISATVKFISCEPFLEELTFSRLDVFNWITIGGSTGQPNWPEQQPEWRSVVGLIEQAEKAGCKVFCKPNLKPVWPKEYVVAPDGVGELSVLQV